jgi:hypothetical protein
VGRAAGLVVCGRKERDAVVVPRRFEQNLQRDADGERGGLRRQVDRRHAGDAERAADDRFGVVVTAVRAGQSSWRALNLSGETVASRALVNITLKTSA